MRVLFISLLLGCLSLFMHSVAIADGVTVHLGGWSPGRDYDGQIDGWEPNTSHELIAVTYRGLMVGRFKNSYYQDTHVIAKSFHVWSGGHLEANIMAGAMYGYSHCYSGEYHPPGEPARWCPALLPELAYTRWRVQPVLSMFGSIPVAAIRVQF